MAKTIKQLREAAPGYATNTSLGGPALRAKALKQRKKNPKGLELPETGKNVYETIVKKVKEEKYSKEKHNKGATDTGQTSNPVDTEPEQKMMTGYQ